MYIAVSAFEDSTNTTPVDTFSNGTFDNMAVWFGRENADVQTGELGYGYWLYGNSFLRTKKINWRDEQLQSYQSNSQGQALGPDKTSHMSYELKIPKQELSEVMKDNRVKAGFHYWNDYDSGPSFWGPPGVTVYDLERYGLLIFSQYGDLNIDGTVDLSDAILSLQICAGIPSGSEVSLSADANGDGKIGLADSVYILQNLAEKRQ